jgi:hypothetical protein
MKILSIGQFMVLSITAAGSPLFSQANCSATIVPVYILITDKNKWCEIKVLGMRAFIKRIY